MELVDTHCHLNFSRYDHDRADVLRRAFNAGVKRIIIPAIDLESGRQALALSAKERGVYAAVGIHPNSSVDFRDSDLDRLRKMANNCKVVAVGEIGLDYHWDKSPKPTQWRAFEAQLALAAQLELPVIIHSREGRVDTAPPRRVDTAPPRRVDTAPPRRVDTGPSAGEDVMAILANWAPTAPAKLRDRLGVLHSFSASDDIAQRALELGFYLGFTGPVTFKKANALRDVARRIPIDRLLIETDGPFLAPQQRRGKRNEPACVRFINAKLAELHGAPPEEMARQTTRNAERLFALPSA